MPGAIPQLGRPLPRMGVALGATPRAAADPFTAVLPPGTWNWVSPADGTYDFVIWGSGGSGGSGNFVAGAASGAYARKRRFVPKGEVVVIVVAKAASGGTGTGGNPSTVTFADGYVMTAGGADSLAATGVGGVATGGDVNINGTAKTSAAADGGAGLGTGGGLGGTSSGGVNSGGAGAPGEAPYYGGHGIQTSGGLIPGHGAGATSGGGGLGISGTGLGLIVKVA